MLKSIYGLFIITLLLPLSTPAQADVSSALKAADSKRWESAYAQASGIRDPLERDVFNWFAYKSGDPRASFNNIADLMARRPNWPSQNKIQESAEKRIPSSMSPSNVIAFFNKNSPVSSEGMMAYAFALSTSGQRSKLNSIMSDWWLDASISREGQKEIYANFGGYISRAAHVKRMNNLMTKREYSNASGIASVLGGGYPALINARRALRGKGDATSALNAVPNSLQSDAGLLLDRLTWRRKKNMNSGAIEILNRSPSASKMSAPKAWWKERNIIARRLIENRQYAQAYQVVSRHKQTEGFPKTQAEWVSGWLALRFLNKPQQAFGHFERLYNNVTTPISKSRGAYWAGLASQTMGRDDVARKWYQVASKYPQTYYGQMAARSIGQQPQIMRADNSNGVRATNMAGTDLGRAARVLRNGSQFVSYKAFIKAMYLNNESRSELLGAAKYAKDAGYDEIGILAAQKLEKSHGITSIKYLYPVISSAKQYSNGLPVERVHAIIRQESRFDKNAVSHASARGLMQLMPATASETARKIGVSHQKSWLTSKPNHNIRLGSTYLKSMLNRYNGDLGMAAAAYNAGPGRVDKWIHEIGDPRTNQIDMLDWAELIPIYETRNYVQRVLEGEDVYRQLTR